MMCPYACVNDGIVDITWTADAAVNSLSGVANAMEKAKKGGV